MNITVIGTGYVGLVTGACFAEMGNSVVCIDVDPDKVERLQQGHIPIYEPGLDAIVTNNSKAGRLRFSTDLAAAMQQSALYFIAVGTPPDEDGSADLSHVLQVAGQIGQHLSRDAIVVNKSTAPVGTADKVAHVIRQQLQTRGVTDVHFDVVSNPEFLKEGAAIDDFMRPDRIVIGVESNHARQVMAELYQTFSRNHDKVMFMGVRDAELTKYAANAMLATKISFMNEMANLAERMGVDIEQVRKGIGSDSRIGYSFIYPGCGYGGSCFPKDVQALVRMGAEYDYNTSVLNAVEQRNQSQKQRLFEKLQQRFPDLAGKVIAVWGLAFKPGTDDMREASSITLINALAEAGARIQAYDPVAMDEAKKHFPASWFDDGTIRLCAHQYDALENADAMVLVTEWKPFRQPDFNAIGKLLKQPIIIDGRNQYDPHSLKQQGFDYTGIGRDIA
ncbi:UDP-glucose 6-dehydrogenase [Bacterioplanes sanyensis]|uniref:UDP-glucose 6-dehydrogenase n=1 Tax=Bacterioplanes sanyensis TaxID=1249553 RepID=A0A222FNL2_9GAMM|nr:UDP-glucose/GDP-mannose dehydrogenase family protein [Bacterioplanes sanyensis]ASP39803.1 UDP-glucose 6-dehydrogenase [Bacterioplanes sanyensis]